MLYEIPVSPTCYIPQRCLIHLPEALAQWRSHFSFLLEVGFSFLFPTSLVAVAGCQSFRNTEELKSSSIDVAAEDNLISKPMLLGEEPINYGIESESTDHLTSEPAKKS